jgi:uncharacterized protein
MHVLVSGSTGLIGSALVDILAARGHRVSRLVRPGPSGSAPDTTGAIAWDPAAHTIDTAALEAAGPFDGVVHLAGAGVGDKRWSPARKQVILSSRTDGTSLLAGALAGLSTPPPVLVSSSAVGYYGDRGDEVLTEDSAHGTGFLADVCVAWEAAAAPAADAGIRVVLLRTGIVLSASGGALGKQLPLFRLGLGGRIGSGRQYRSWITLEDQVGAIVHCLGDGSLSGPVNATGPEPATDAELARALGHALHRPSVLAVPAPALKVVLGPEMATDMVLSSQRVLPTRLTASEFTFAHPELGAAVGSVLGR